MYEQMQKERKRLDKLRTDIQAQLATLPEGHLIHSRNGTQYKFYHKLNGQRIYLPKQKLDFIKQLALKRYLTSQKEDLEHKIQAIDCYLKEYSMKSSKSTQLLNDIPLYRELLDEYYQPVSCQLALWKNEPFEKNTKYPEYLVHKSISGNLLRSKSEALIDMLLYTHKIPYRYECALHLGEVTLYPDFTIRHPKTGKLFYFEHFGLMDDPSYCHNTCSKLQVYMNHGIIPSLQLITTFETKDTPLTSDKIEKIIQQYFLQ